MRVQVSCLAADASTLGSQNHNAVVVRHLGRGLQVLAGLADEGLLILLVFEDENVVGVVSCEVTNTRNHAARFQGNGIGSSPKLVLSRELTLVNVDIS